MALGKIPVESQQLQRHPAEDAHLEALSGAERLTFIDMHEMLGYAPPQKPLGFLDKLRGEKPEGPFVSTEKPAIYREEDMPHNEVMAAYLLRERGSRQVGLFTQVIEYVGAWLPAEDEEPRLRALTLPGGRVSYEGKHPQVFEASRLQYQTFVIASVRQTLDFIRGGVNALGDTAPDLNLNQA